MSRVLTSSHHLVEATDIEVCVSVELSDSVELVVVGDHINFDAALLCGLDSL